MCGPAGPPDRTAELLGSTATTWQRLDRSLSTSPTPGSSEISRTPRWLTALAVIFEIVGVVWVRGGLGIDASKGAADLPANYSNTLELGQVLYTKYVYPFELAAVLLLVAIVAAIALTMRKRPGHKVQDISKQVAVQARDRVRIVKMESEKRS